MLARKKKKQTKGGRRGKKGRWMFTEVITKIARKRPNSKENKKKRNIYEKEGEGRQDVDNRLQKGGNQKPPGKRPVLLYC